MSRHNIYRTSRGIEIGGAYIERPPPMSEDAELLQAGLLRKEPMKTNIANILLAVVIGILLAAWAFHWWSS